MLDNGLKGLSMEKENKLMKRDIHMKVNGNLEKEMDAEKYIIKTR